MYVYVRARVSVCKRASFIVYLSRIKLMTEENYNHACIHYSPFNI